MAKAKQVVNFVRSETDLLSEPGCDLTLSSSNRVDYHPITNIQDRSTPLTFIIQGNDLQYIDFSETQLYVRCKIVDSKGAAQTSSNIAPVNNFLHSMIHQVTILLNDVQITPPSTLYPYKAFMETFLSFGKEYTKTQAQAALYSKEIEPTTDDAGWISRESLSHNSKVFEMRGKLRCDIFNQNRYLIPGVDVKIVLNRSPDNFCLLGKTPTAGSTLDQAQVHIVEAKLVVQKHTLFPSITLTHLKLLDKGQPACYPMRRGDIKSFSLSA
ncbi:uncharacterized protein F54H12.2-like [Folsomia candida]|uniref:uncharacterized protein F54H12.2-like n=1 Tax=Folsomia candida TaxID=158441 RepID=UPI001604C21E|nr:uncharacterized protein F54H12.2-like [Folsomia candida]